MTKITERMWAVVSPQGCFLPSSFARLRRDAIAAAGKVRWLEKEPEDREEAWAEMRDRGFRAVRVVVSEVD